MRVTGISPLRGSLRAAHRQAYHCVLTGSLRDSLSSCFVDGWVPLTALHWPSFMRGTRTGGSWRILQSRFTLLAGRQGTYFSCRIFNFQGARVLTGVRQMRKTVRGYCSSRSNRRPPGSVSIAGAGLLAWVIACWPRGDASLPISHHQSGLEQLRLDTWVRVR